MEEHDRLSIAWTGLHDADPFATRNDFTGGDIAFMSGVLKALDEIAGWDEAFLARATHGAGELRAELRRLSFRELEADAGVDEAEMRRFAQMYKAASRAVFVYSMGLTQYEFGVDNVRMVVNLALARGMIGRPGTGVMPIRGHSGVQGSAECGADPEKLPALEHKLTGTDCRAKAGPDALLDRAWSNIARARPPRPCAAWR